MSTTEDVCDHGVSYDRDCPTCEREIAEAKAVGALTPHEIGLYWKGREAENIERERMAYSAERRAEEAEFHVEQLRDARDGAERRIERAERLIDGWEHDGPEDPAIHLLIQRVREALDGSRTGEEPCPTCGGAMRFCECMDDPFARAPDEDCDHEWLDRPESDTRECLICGVEVAG